MAESPPLELRCATCGALLAGPLLEVRPHGCPLTMTDGQPALPSGLLWRVVGDPEFQGLLPGNLVVNLKDLRETRPCGARHGCCGPSGLDGPNLACPAGHVVGTEVADCWTPHLAHFVPDAVVCVPAQEEGVRLLVFEAGSEPTAWHFTGWLHAQLGAGDWFGTDVAALAAWFAKQPGPVVRILWRQPAGARGEGLDPEQLAQALASGGDRLALVRE